MLKPDLVKHANKPGLEHKKRFNRMVHFCGISKKTYSLDSRPPSSFQEQNRIGTLGRGKRTTAGAPQWIGKGRVEEDLNIYRSLKTRQNSNEKTGIPATQLEPMEPGK
jgi:hypothetical protein